MLCCISRSNSSQKKIYKPFKVRNLNGSRRIGIAVESVADLRKKAREKFKLKRGESLTLVLEEDGTEVDDDEYLQTLHPHTVLVILMKGERWEGVSGQLEIALQNVLSASNLPQVAEEIDELINSEKNPAYREIFSQIVDNLKMNVDAERRVDDPNWFTDIPVRFKTKNAYMREKARQRVRGYLYHTRDYIKSQNLTSSSKKALGDVSQYFVVKLKKQDYFSDYFDRCSPSDDLRMCDSDGWFECEGLFDENNCRYRHLINPYGNYQSRRLLSTWDLDHGIEKSRSILPCLKEAASNPKRQLNKDYFFDLLFTRQNLKLVNPVCHDKSSHSTAQCDTHLIYMT